VKFIIQRVKQAKVTVDHQVAGSIDRGFLVLIGVSKEDVVDMEMAKKIADRLIKKLIYARIFQDENGKTNLGLKDVNGQLLLVSQFTLYADCKKGNRPSFINAGSPDKANEIYEYIINECMKEIAVVERGIFGASMDVELINEGPFTIVLDSEEI